jgi:hypothetical protein
VVYIREAHPSDGWQVPSNVRSGIVFEDPKDIQARRVVAKNCIHDLGLEIPTLLDGMDNAMMKAYNAWPNRVYVLGGDGIVYWKGPRGPGGVSRARFEAPLEELLALPGGGRLTDRAPRLSVLRARPVRIEEIEGLVPARVPDGFRFHAAREDGRRFEIDPQATLAAGRTLLETLGIAGTSGGNDRVREEELVALSENGRESDSRRSRLFRLRYRHFHANAAVEGDFVDLVYDAEGLREVRGVWHRVESSEISDAPRRSSLEAAKVAKLTNAVARPLYVRREAEDGSVRLVPVFRLTRGKRVEDVEMIR